MADQTLDGGRKADQGCLKSSVEPSGKVLRLLTLNPPGLYLGHQLSGAVLRLLAFMLPGLRLGHQQLLHLQQLNSLLASVLRPAMSHDCVIRCYSVDVHWGGIEGTVQRPWP